MENTELNKVVAEIIRSRRLQLGLSQEELATHSEEEKTVSVPSALTGKASFERQRVEFKDAAGNLMKSLALGFENHLASAMNTVRIDLKVISSE